jgi:hypothetical protein
MSDDPRGPRRYRYRCDACGWVYLTWADNSDGTADPVCSRKPPGTLSLIEVLPEACLSESHSALMFFRAPQGPYRIEKKHKRAGKARFLRALKLTCGCIDCGYRDDPDRLSFDHRTLKDFNVSTGVNRSWRQLIAEVEKCEVRCLACHANRHSAPHGQCKNELVCKHEAARADFHTTSASLLTANAERAHFLSKSVGAQREQRLGLPGGLVLKAEGVAY